MAEFVFNVLFSIFAETVYASLLVIVYCGRLVLYEGISAGPGWAHESKYFEVDNLPDLSIIIL